MKKEAMQKNMLNYEPFKNHLTSDLKEVILKWETKDLKLSKGNSKTGKIPALNIMPDSICEYKTPWCSQFCYAKKALRYKATYRRYILNTIATHNMTERELFTSIAKQLGNSRILRIHSSGGFYSFEYAVKLKRVIDLLFEFDFLNQIIGYTKSMDVYHLFEGKLRYSIVPDTPKTELKDINYFKVLDSLDGIDKKNQCKGDCITCLKCINPKIKAIFVKKH